ncbi:hypothetical protein HY642_00940, partial [Candidatus Woesearchaeota archaeon]|nr:hypothetical protein [Candidatus Woesearchaeota archaeon]
MTWLALFMLSLLALQAGGVVLTGISIVNAGPSINAVATFSSYANRSENVPSSGFSYAQGSVVYVQANITDLNGYSDVVQAVAVLALFDNRTGIETLLARQRVGRREFAAGNEALFTFTFDMISADETRQAPLFYRVRVNATDGSIVGSGFADFTFATINVTKTGNYSNSSLSFAENTTLTFNTALNLSLSLELRVNASNASIDVMSYVQDPFDAENTAGAVPLGRHVSIDVPHTVNQNLSWGYIAISYADSELAVSGGTLDASTLRIYRWNSTAQAWKQVTLSGVDTVTRIVWANLSSFSTYGVFGSLLQVSIPSTPATGGAGGGGGGAGTAGPAAKKAPVPVPMPVLPGITGRPIRGVPIPPLPSEPGVSRPSP